jgi:hypothetical protein
MEGVGGEVDTGSTGGWTGMGGDDAGESLGVACRNDEERRLPREFSVKADLRFVEEARWRVGGGGERPWQADMKELIYQWCQKL